MTTTTEPTAREQLAELEERVRNGDERVTAAALAKARDAVQMEDLRSEALERARAAEAQANLETEQARVRAEELPRITAAIDEVRAAYDAAYEAATTLAATIESMASVVDDVRRAARSAKIGDEARDLWAGHTFLPAAEPVLAVLAADAAGKPRTHATRERGVVAFNREWWDSDERAVISEADLEPRNAKARAKNAADAKRRAEWQAEREEAGLEEGEVRLTVNGLPVQHIEGPDAGRMRRKLHNAAAMSAATRYQRTRSGSAELTSADLAEVERSLRSDGD